MATVNFELLGNITQTQYENLIGVLASALRTQRKFIEICGRRQGENGETIYRVKSKGYYYHITLNGNRIINVAYEV